MAEVPIELPTGRVVGRFIFEVQDNDDPGEEPQLIPVTGDVTIKSSIDNLTIFDPTLGKFITFRGPHKAIVDASGELSTPDPTTNEPMYPGISLWSNDSDKLSVKGWTYTATFNLKTIDGKALNLQPVTFTLATGQEVDLADVVKVPATPGYGLPQAEGAALRAEAAALEAEQSSAAAIQMAQSVIDRADAGEFEGAQGPAGNATMRVDTTVGTRVFVSDGTTERMIKGDTGWHKVIVAPKEGRHSGGEIRWRRSNDTVQLFLVGITLLEGVGFVVILDAADIPFGFRAVNTDRAFYLIGLSNSATSGQVISRYTSSAIAWNQTLSGSTTRPTSGSLQGVLEWTTDQDWPIELPGIPL